MKNSSNSSISNENNDWLIVFVPILALIIGLVISIIFPPKLHIYIDSTHKICDGECICDGMECGHYELDTDSMIRYYIPPSISERRAILSTLDSVKLTNDSTIRYYTEAISSEMNYAMLMRDYQILILGDTLVIYDGKRRVGVIPFKYDNDALSTLIMEDNK